MTALDAVHWQARLTELLDRYGVVGASLAIRAGDASCEAAAGVLSSLTQQPVTPDSVFQVGSVTKAWTATLMMQLLDDGLLDLDEPVRGCLPGFRLADEELAASVTTRELLTHTSGIDGDVFLDTGRGDDAVERYVERMAGLSGIVPRGALMSYSNSGYVLLGHLVAQVRKAPWEQVLREHLIEPLGAESAGAFPEEAIRYGVAVGHVHEDGVTQVTPRWTVPRSMGPAGLLHSNAREQLLLASLHLSGGLGPDGSRVLSETSAAAMRVPHVTVPDPWLLGTHWGLGWFLSDSGGSEVFGHDGSICGQAAFLRVVPSADIAICLLTNGGRAPRDLFRAVCAELGWPLPAVPEPSGAPVDVQRYAGVYERTGARIEIAERDGGAVFTSTGTGLTAGTRSGELLHHRDDVLLLCQEGADSLVPVVFVEHGPDLYLHCGGRTTRRASV